MTREEAIHELTEWREQMKNHGVPNWSAKLNALDMAIEALQEQKCYWCAYWNSETKGCKRNPSVQAWEEDDYCSYYVAIEAPAEPIVCEAIDEIDMLTRMYEPSDLISRAVQGEWIPCGEKMPKELERVNVTWLNHNPPFYYQHIKDIPQTDTAVYYRGKWYWWDATVIDVLAEYGEDCNAEQIDKDIEVVAWMPLPKPYSAKMGGDSND